MTISVTKCDVCRMEKGEGNKWLKATIVESTAMETHTGIYFGDSGLLDICSDGCAIKLYNLIAPRIRSVMITPDE